MRKLEGKTAIVTGGAGGIGEATAALFVREGANVMLVDLDETALRKTCEKLGRNCAYFASDVSMDESAGRYVAAAVARFGGLDILFANAGTEGTVAPIQQLPVEAFDRVLAVNLRGAFLAIQAAAPELAKRGGGSIVVTSSVAGVVGASGLSAYVASKHAVIGMVRAAALDLSPLGIRINTVNPGPIDNRMMRSIEGQIAPGHAEDVKHGFEGKIPLGRYGTNDDIARMVLFLASDDAAYCTGAVFVVDGGYCAQ